MRLKEFTQEHRDNLSKNHYSTKYRKGKNYEEIYGCEKSKEYKEKLSIARKKYKNQKDRLGDKYDEYVNQLKNRFQGDGNPMKKNKYLWYYSDITGKQIRIVENGNIPIGYIKGRKPKKNK